MTNERYLQLEDRTIYESDVGKMSIPELQELLIEIDRTERTVSAKRKNYMSRFLNKGNKDQFNKNMDSFRTALDRIHEAQQWIASAKRKKNQDSYKENQINKSFVELARQELKSKVFIGLMKKAKEMTA